MDNRIPEVVIDDWSKGINTQDIFLEDGYCQNLDNFDCSNKGKIKKVLREVNLFNDDVGTGLFDGVDFDTIIKTHFHYMNNTDYFVVFAKDTGSLPNGYDDYMIALCDFDDTETWTYFKSSDGYFTNENDETDDTHVEDARFVSSNVGGRSILRVYPIYNDEDDLNEWRPLRVMYLPRPKCIEDIGFTRPEGTGNEPKKLVIDGENKIMCSCGLGNPFPCNVGGDEPISAACVNLQHRCNFDTEFDVGDLIAIQYMINTQGGAVDDDEFRDGYLSKITEITDEAIAYVKGPVYQNKYDNADDTDPGGEDFTKGTYFYTMENDGEYCALVEGIYCLRGLPILREETVDDQVYIGSDPDTTAQYNIPIELKECTYEGFEDIYYGFTFITIDNQFSNMVVRQHLLGQEDYFNATPPDDSSVTCPAYGYINITFDADMGGWVFSPPAGATDSELNVYETIKGLVVWRKVGFDSDWQVLDIVHRYIPVENESNDINEWNSNHASSDITGSSLQDIYNADTIGSETNYDSSAVKDYGQVLLETVYSFTGGLEEEDLGVETVIKAPCSHNRKIYGGNYCRLKRWNDEWEPEWLDDEIAISLVDKGESFGALDYLGVASGESDYIVDIKVDGRQLLIFKRKHVTVVEMVGSEQMTWKLVKHLNSGVDYYYHTCKTPYGVVWLSRDGIFIWNDNRRILISHAIEDEYFDEIDGFPSTIRLGYDAATDKIFINNSSTGTFWSINIKQGAFQVVNHLGDYIWLTPDLNGRLTGLVEGSLDVDYLERKETEREDGVYVAPASYTSGKMDMVKLVGCARIYSVHYYIKYVVEDEQTGSFATEIDMDGSTATEIFDGLSGSGEKIFKQKVWLQGRIAQVELVVGNRFELFEVHRVVISTREFGE